MLAPSSNKSLHQLFTLGRNDVLTPRYNAFIALRRQNRTVMSSSAVIIVESVNTVRCGGAFHLRSDIFLKLF